MCLWYICAIDEWHVRRIDRNQTVRAEGGYRGPVDSLLDIGGHCVLTLIAPAIGGAFAPLVPKT
jgi:hypothetical protein